MKEEVLRSYLELSPQIIQQQLVAIANRRMPAVGKRQVPFTAVETLLCYGLFYVIDPHRYGGGNIEKVPAVVKTLAAFFRRSPGSLTSKMLNLDGHGLIARVKNHCSLPSSPLNQLVTLPSIVLLSQRHETLRSMRVSFLIFSLAACLPLERQS